MPPVAEEKPASFQEYVALIEKYQAMADKSLWYRGCDNATNPLLPGLYRHRSVKKAEDFPRLEEQLMMRFRQRSLPFVSRPLGDEWETLFIMQHYGVPTRLLDWTENPFIGLFFAVVNNKFSTKSKGTTKRLVFKNDAVVWLLDPIAWNHHALRHQSFDRGIPFTNDEALQPYKPPATTHDARNLPVAINGAHNSTRIVAQRGAFTIFGDNIHPMEQAYAQDGFPANSLVKIVLSKDLVPILRLSALNHGITESVVFPDLDGLSREMKREFDFED
jgi:FRG domain